MQRTIGQMLERAKRVSRRITTEEQIESGVAALDRAGLLEAAEEWAGTQMFADGRAMTVEDVAISLSTANRYSVTTCTKFKRLDTKNEDRWDSVQEKLERIHELITEQQSSNLSKDWYSVNEVVAITDFKPYTIRQLCNTGRLKDDWIEKHYRTGEWRINRDAVEWIQNHGLPPVK